MSNRLAIPLALAAAWATMLATAQQPAPPTPAAQAPAAAAPIPPSWAQGRKADQEAANLSPHPPGLTALAEKEIPVANLKAPPGFHVTVYAAGAPNARSMAFGKDGTLFVGTRFPGNVYAIVDKGDHREVKTIAKGMYRSNGVAYKNGTLYVAELSRILKYENIDANLDNPPAPKVVYDNLPKDEAHGWKFMTMGPDGWLYFQIGAPGNIVMPPYTHATINRVNPDKGVLEVVARGVRNSVGMDFHPVTHELWFTNNGRDWVGDDMPNDTLHRVSAKNMNFGYPFCHEGALLDDEFGKGHTCDEFDKPAAKLGPHVAALGMRFYTGSQFPAEYRNNIFIAEHGSWNRSKKTGYNISRVVLDAKGKVVKYEPFITGWLQGEEFWGRPADVQVAPDGSLLVSDDTAGAIFKVSYRK
ncbi:MAG TPA: PQQ-dependent sugar dehydrogenase [Usitatibacter sp.]|jgi:glucose/arabinose dehydrogenase|nr:PQQ-dependent sugar dehydrogenase [Usitatibacter sp.]